MPNHIYDSLLQMKSGLPALDKPSNDYATILPEFT
jgi:hypothetical protein